MDKTVKNKYAVGLNAAVTIKDDASLFTFKGVFSWKRMMIGKRAADHLGTAMVQCHYI